MEEVVDGGVGMTDWLDEKEMELPNAGESIRCDKDVILRRKGKV